MRRDSRLHDGRVERLGNVIDGPQGKPFFLVLGVVDRGNNDDRNTPGRAGFFQLFQDDKTGHVRENDVQQNQVGSAFVRDLERPFARFGDEYRIVLLEDMVQNVDVRSDVFDNQDTGFRSCTQS